MSTSEQPTTLRERTARLNDSDAEDVKGQVASSSRAAKDKAVAASKDTKDIAIQQVRVAATIGTEAVTSGAYLYPIEVRSGSLLDVCEQGILTPPPRRHLH